MEEATQGRLHYMCAYSHSNNTHTMHTHTCKKIQFSENFILVEIDSFVRENMETHVNMQNNYNCF